MFFLSLKKGKTLRITTVLADVGMYKTENILLHFTEVLGTRQHSTRLRIMIIKFSIDKNQTRERKCSVGDEGHLLPGHAGFHPWVLHHDWVSGHGRDSV